MMTEEEAKAQGQEHFDQLIKALTIFKKYAVSGYPFHCEHDVLWICAGIHGDDVSDEDIKELDELGFFYDEEDESFKSYKFGSA